MFSSSELGRAGRPRTVASARPLVDLTPQTRSALIAEIEWANARIHRVEAQRAREAEWPSVVAWLTGMIERATARRRKALDLLAALDAECR